ncbi:MAG: RNase adapter RapZ [Acidobacteria bacterium]|nr:RNase adapter RapZ [Acidobacteriota bacterium]
MSLQDLVIVTGMSGSGKGTVLRTFEDLGFFCIDNLPVSLIPKLVEGLQTTEDEVKHAVLVIDIRAGEKLKDLEAIIRGLRQSAFHLFVLYLEADDDVLVRRFSETRRPHPLSGENSLRDSIRLEREKLHSLREFADVAIDTSRFNVHEIKKVVVQRFRKHSRTSTLNIHLLSFGYKKGVPQEADLMFDARFLPNPYFVPRIRIYSGKDKSVVRYLESFPETNAFIKRLGNLLKYLIPKYIKEGKRYLTVAVGCTGGRHRSVFVVEALAKMLESKNRSIHIQHRDINQ